jgi:plastocyanin
VAVEPGTTVVREWTGNGDPHNVIYRPGPDPAQEGLFNSQATREGFTTAKQVTTFE